MVAYFAAGGMEKRGASEYTNDTFILLMRNVLKRVIEYIPKSIRGIWCDKNGINQQVDNFLLISDSCEKEASVEDRLSSIVYLITLVK